ncbi:MAG: iron-only hydrogenase maturation protein HydF [Halanaerobium sp. 4-GBenrich]|jgi:[FeFe] hydrogenase H-cluster maturation GTPase HydF|uniref:Iron-only hydrogenase maturation protein HydF n=2 Tax=Halanaerobium TaxID=2330 RepID=A0A1G6RG36_9FIRM|nr:MULTISPECIES: [FeFe] hydrogenase H-cluster maturation GTPase HydF [Halanaerobium]ODS50809.1 MAG: iron-only hydrogenase maturation protein HydF [Halanaerobium sp. 4-GBenrich]OEG62417.1 MAG: [FeFe] hydrogenase H-cluster maturation GTPase HydF [Halanaerobium sp. MDAL1]PUU86759.1 MAG: FeFe hydrogenase maturation protein HydF [Halanaerobium sp.]PUU90429.1 MAG: iron-only hydrogenase maturation protein HydF [Halanaerobium sp.]PXV65374.1 iron-only hydrogenase maturation protein HydF [Halanaerobium 
MNSTAKGDRPHIAVFGRRNVGKSSLINKLTNQKLALVSSQPGTTTDPVYKAMELLPIGPVMMIDTAGIDDQGELGEMRIKKTKEIMRKTDLALLVISAVQGAGEFEADLIKEFKERDIPFIVVLNKIELLETERAEQRSVLKELDQFLKKFKLEFIKASADQEINIDLIREVIAEEMPEDCSRQTIMGDLINTGDTVVLVTPIDSAAPKGRLILPQVQTIRDILDHDAAALVTKKTKVKSEIDKLKNPPKIVVTDSQAFETVSKEVAEEILLTGFSVLFARYKGDLKTFVRGAKAMEKLKAGDKVLVAEACTHRRQQDDIGTVKIPNWIHSKISPEIEFDHVSGREFPDNLEDYTVILHCGSCMLNRKEVLSRLKEAEAAGVPVINYGMGIAWLHGILDRALEPFPEALELWHQDQEKIVGVI